MPWQNTTGSITQASLVGDLVSALLRRRDKTVEGKADPAQMRKAVQLMQGGAGPKKAQATLAQDNFNAGGSGSEIPSMTQLQSQRRALSRSAAGSSGVTILKVRSLCVVLAVSVIRKAAMSLRVRTNHQRWYQFALMGPGGRCAAVGERKPLATDTRRIHAHTRR